MVSRDEKVLPTKNEGKDKEVLRELSEVTRVVERSHIDYCTNKMSSRAGFN